MGIGDWGLGPICIGDDDNLTPRCLQDFAELIEKYPQLDLFHARSELSMMTQTLLRR